MAEYCVHFRKNQLHGENAHSFLSGKVRHKVPCLLGNYIQRKNNEGMPHIWMIISGFEDDRTFIK